MKTIIYGSKTFILENHAAIDLMTRAAERRDAGQFEEAQSLLSSAIRAEAGLPIMEADLALAA